MISWESGRTYCKCCQQEAFVIRAAVRDGQTAVKVKSARKGSHWVRVMQLGK